MESLFNNTRAYVGLLIRSLRHRNVVRGVHCTLSRRCSISDDTTLGKAVMLGPGVCLRKAQIGDYSYLGRSCNVSAAAIGKFCSIASEVYIGLGSHPLEPFVSTHPIFYLRKPDQHWNLADRDCREEYADTAIGNDVWIGLRAAIRDGITVGDGAIIASGAIVTKDVPPYAIVAGVPARIVRYRFPPETVEQLLEFKWWDRDENWLMENWRMFHDAMRFIQQCHSEGSNSHSRIAANGRAVS